MKILIIFAYILFINQLNAQAFDVNRCEKKDNIFFSTVKTRDGANCIDRDMLRAKFTDLKAISEKLYSSVMDSCKKKIDFLVNPDEVNIKECQDVVKCTSDLRQIIKSGSDRTLICSMDYFEGLSKQQMIYQSLEGFKKDRLNNSRDLELKNLKERVKDAVGEEFFSKNFDPKIDACKVTKANNQCLKDTPGIDLEMLRSYIKYYAVEDIGEKLKQSVDLEELEFLGRNIQVVTHDHTSRRRFGLSPSGDADAGVTAAIYRNKNFNKKREGIKILVNKLLTHSKVKIELFDNDFSNFDEADKKIKLMSYLKEAYRSNCDMSLEDESKICQEFGNYLKERVSEGNEESLRPDLALSKFVKEKEKLLSGKDNNKDKLSLNLDSILNYNNADAKFDFNQYLNLTQQTYLCNLRYQNLAFGKNDEEFKAYNENLKQQGNTVLGIINNDIGKTLSSSADHIERQGLGDVGRSITSDLKNLSMDYRQTSAAYLASDNSIREHSTSGGFGDSVDPKNGESLSHNLGNDSESFFGGNGANLFNRNSYNQSGDKFSLNPNSGKFSDSGSPIGSTSGTSLNSAEANANNASISRKIDELSERETKLKKKIEEGEATPLESVEVAELRRQIEELKKQMNDQQSKTVGVVATGKGSATSDRGQTARQISSADSGPSQVSFEDRAIQRGQSVSGAQNNNFSSNNSDFQAANDRSNFFGNASRSTAAVGGRSTGSNDSRSYGLVLTKSGELTSDLSKIVENPKESEIIGLLEKNDGRPFLIRENGVLVQVQIEKDHAGRVVTINGRPKLKKLKIGTDKEVLVQKELNMIREAKKTTDTVRLRDLNQTTREALK